MVFKKLLRYIEQRPYHVLVFLAALFLSTTTHLQFAGIATFIINFIMEYLHYNTRVEFLHKKGLTAQQYSDKVFVESWTETRESGLTRYCVFDGGIIIGTILSLFVGAVFFKTNVLGDVSQDFSSMMGLIWKSFIIGFMIAVCINRIRWIYREKRFEKLTSIPYQLGTSLPAR